MKTKKENAKRSKSLKRNVKKVRSTFVDRPQKTLRVKSKTGKSTSSTKVGKGSFIARTTTMMKRILRVKH